MGGEGSLSPHWRTTRDALRRVTEAEQRIKCLAERVYSPRRGTQPLVAVVPIHDVLSSPRRRTVPTTDVLPALPPQRALVRGGVPPTAGTPRPPPDSPVDTGVQCVPSAASEGVPTVPTLPLSNSSPYSTSSAPPHVAADAVAPVDKSEWDRSVKQLQTHVLPGLTTVTSIDSTLEAWATPTGKSRFPVTHSPRPRQIKKPQELRPLLVCDEGTAHATGPDTVAPPPPPQTDPPAMKIVVEDMGTSPATFEDDTALRERVRRLEGVVVALQREVEQLRKSVSSQQHLRTSASPGPHRPSNSHSPADNDDSAVAATPFLQLSPAGWSFPSQEPELHLEGLHTIPLVKSRGSFSSVAVSPRTRRDVGATPNETITNTLRVTQVQYIVAAFDTDGDGYLGFRDCKKFQSLTEHTELALDDWRDLCAYLGVDAARGLDAKDLLRMYAESETGEADLERDVRVAQQHADDEGISVKALDSAELPATRSPCTSDVR